MSTHSAGQITVKNLKRNEVGEVAALGHTLGYRVTIEDDDEVSGRAMVTMVRVRPTWGKSELAALVTVEAIAWGQTLDQVLDGVRWEVERSGLLAVTADHEDAQSASAPTE